MTNRVREIKHAQRESVLLREISNFFLRIAIDDDRLQGLQVNRVKLSADRGVCTVFFYTEKGINDFEEKRATLVLYKPSLRNALSKTLQSRRIPELRFVYDAQFAKQRHIDDLLQKLKDEGEL
ncbi:MAG TPA: ribosome-binding factor A [Candidatus Dependentiae bacterium]|nr:ribosome-binding factor A [Candidatus Dependentiae bacterium]HRQ62714.1 ribosome-binding factor A [Candidatus Dependentiae bacterium]